LLSFHHVSCRSERDKSAGEQIRSLQSAVAAGERALADLRAEQARDKRAHGDALEAQRQAMEAKAKTDADKL
jgi:vacuolar-type H+-ATPase subunit I/STV1